MSQPIRAPRIRDAIVAAAVQLKDDLGTQKAAASAAGVTQQTISTAINEKKVGFDLLLGLAEAFNATIDDLLARFGGYPEGKTSVRVGDLPGWVEAEGVARAMLTDAPELVWLAAASVRLPMRPRVATPKLALRCAEVVMACGESSGVRERLLLPAQEPKR